MTRLAMAFRYKYQGGHVWVRVFAGPDADHRAKCGDLTFTVDEWVIFMQGLARSRGAALDMILVDETHEQVPA